MLYLVVLSTLFKRSTFFLTIWAPQCISMLIRSSCDGWNLHAAHNLISYMCREGERQATVLRCDSLLHFKLLFQDNMPNFNGNTIHCVISWHQKNNTPKEKWREPSIAGSSLKPTHAVQSWTWTPVHTPTLQNSFTRNQTRTRGTREAIKKDLKRFQNSEHSFPLNWRFDTHKGRKKYPELGRNHKKVKRCEVNQVKIELNLMTSKSPADLQQWLWPNVDPCSLNFLLGNFTPIP